LIIAPISTIAETNLPNERKYYLEFIADENCRVADCKMQETLGTLFLQNFPLAFVSRKPKPPISQPISME
jgi:hypothetical protein